MSDNNMDWIKKELEKTGNASERRKVSQPPLLSTRIIGGVFAAAGIIIIKLGYQWYQGRL